MRNFLINIFLFFSIYANAQFIYSDTTWERWYGAQNNNESALAYKNDIEHYDKGYIFHANYEEFMEGKTFIKKTDINGYYLWERRMDSTYQNYILSMKNHEDGGLIMCGISNFTGVANPWVSKLNACMEVEWCKIFEWPEYSFAKDLAIDHNGDIIVLCYGFGYGDIERINLIKLDTEGHIIWKDDYATMDDYPVIWNAIPDKILIGEENDYYIAGEAEWPINNDPSQGWGTRSLFIKVNPNGEEEWILPFGIYDSLYSKPWSIHNLSEGNFVAIGSNYQTHHPVLMYFNENGEEQSFVSKQIMPEDYFSTRLAGSIQISDTSFISIWRYLYTIEEYNYHYGYIKFDTALNIIDYKEDDRWKDPANLIYSYNDKIVTVGRMKENNSSGKYDIYMSKRNLDFTYDTVYPNWTG
ncbi:hypothetical protein, partial [Lentimicrobium sp. S6]|uniref:hypothetical protein n=1 Tax=Lentimicrobium sp. S6 TaxID=2735872 RepID=UPI001555554E